MSGRLDGLPYICNLQAVTQASIMKTSIALCCSAALLALPIITRAATWFEPLRLVSTVDPAVPRSATPNGGSFGMQMAPDGAWVLFLSDASDVTTNHHEGGVLDLYLYDRASRETTLISGDAAGAGGGDAHTGVGRATPDGRFVAFTSTAEDLVDGDTNSLADVFIRDLLENTTECISAGSATPIFGPGYFYGSGGPQLTADARWVAFSSTATNLVAGVTNLHGEIYLRDRQQGTTRCPSDEVFEDWSLPEGSILFQRRAFSPFLSEEGVFLAFIAEVRLRPPTSTPMLHSLWRYEIATGQATLVSTNIALSAFSESTIYGTTPDGRWLAYQTATTDHQNNIELWDGDTGAVLLATVALDGSSGADGFCDAPELSADGRFLVFTSNAGNLVTNVVENSSNVFVRDTVAAHTELISLDPRGTGMGGADLAFPGISHDGAWVVFDSFEGGFVPNDLNLASDVFLRHRESGEIELVSRVEPAAQSASGNGHSSLGVAPFSEDGGRLLFRSESGDLAPGASPGIGQVYVHDAASGMNTLASVNFEGDGAANAWCYEQVISGDGRTVVFTSAADNLAAGDSNDLPDVFLHDLDARSTRLISRALQSASSGNDASAYPALSLDGNWIAFLSYASDLVQPGVQSIPLQAYLHDRQNQVTLRVADPFATTVERSAPRLSPDGRYLAYMNQRWPSADVWLYDHQIRQGAELIPGPAVAAFVGEYFSRDGQSLVAWGWEADSASRDQGFLLRRELISGNSDTIWLGPTRGAGLADLTMDHSARFVAFSTTLSLVPADTNQFVDVYLLDFESSALTLVSANWTGTAAGGGASRSPSISGDGRLVAFVSEAADLVPDDANGTADVFLFDRHTGTLAVASANSDGRAGNDRSGNPRLSPTGHRLAFTSIATDFVPNDRNGRNDVFLTTVHPVLIEDTDGDGMADEWETEHFGGLPALANADADLDGFTNLEEYIAGTDPLDSSSHPRLEISAAAQGHAQLHWVAAPGRTYVVESTPDPAKGAWSAKAGVIRIAGAAAVFGESEPPQEPVYYRLRVSNDTGP